MESCLGWIVPGLGGRGYVLNNHGDPKSPKNRVVGPLPNGYSWLITGMILQVGLYFPLLAYQAQITNNLFFDIAYHI